MQVDPGIDPGVVAVIEGEPDGVVADRVDLGNTNPSLAVDQLFLRRAVALDLGRGAFDAEIFRGIVEGRGVVEIDLEPLLGLLQANLERPMSGVEPTRHGARGAEAGVRRSSSASVRASSTSMIGMPSRMGYARPAWSLINS